MFHTPDTETLRLCGVLASTAFALVIASTGPPARCLVRSGQGFVDDAQRSLGALSNEWGGKVFWALAIDICSTRRQSVPKSVAFAAPATSRSLDAQTVSMSNGNATRRLSWTRLGIIIAMQLAFGYRRKETISIRSWINDLRPPGKNAFKMYERNGMKGGTQWLIEIGFPFQA
jgi:hypothetical protein